MTTMRMAARGLGLTIALGLGCALAQDAPAAAARQTAQKADVAKPDRMGKAATEQDPGERKFQANCSRCHTAPEQLSPRLAGTVLRHMRVRASLSAEDERDLLRYLAP